MTWVCEGTYKYIHDEKITSLVIVSMQLVEPRFTWVLASYPTLGISVCQLHQPLARGDFPIIPTSALCASRNL